MEETIEILVYEIHITEIFFQDQHLLGIAMGITECSCLLNLEMSVVYWEEQGSVFCDSVWFSFL